MILRGDFSHKVPPAPGSGINSQGYRCPCGWSSLAVAEGAHENDALLRNAVDIQRIAHEASGVCREVERRAAAAQDAEAKAAAALAAEHGSDLNDVRMR